MIGGQASTPVSHDIRQLSQVSILLEYTHPKRLNVVFTRVFTTH